jgi:hypothetical protein
MMINECYYCLLCDINTNGAIKGHLKTANGEFHILQVVHTMHKTGLISAVLAYFTTRFELIDSTELATPRNTSLKIDFGKLIKKIKCEFFKGFRDKI